MSTTLSAGDMRDACFATWNLAHMPTPTSERFDAKKSISANYVRPECCVTYVSKKQSRRQHATKQRKQIDDDLEEKGPGGRIDDESWSLKVGHEGSMAESRKKACASLPRVSVPIGSRPMRNVATARTRPSNTGASYRLRANCGNLPRFL